MQRQESLRTAQENVVRIERAVLSADFVSRDAFQRADARRTTAAAETRKAVEAAAKLQERRAKLRALFEEDRRREDARLSRLGLARICAELL
jgi:hypothetical protein